MKRFWILTRSMFLVHIRNRMTLFWNMVFPIFLLAIYGMVFGGMSVGNENYFIWMIPGVIVLNILAYGLMASSTMLVNMRETGVLMRLHATPVNALELVSAYVLINILIALLQSGAILLAAALFFDFRLSAEMLARSVPAVLLAIVTSVAMGQLVSGVAPRVSVAGALGQLLYFSQMFITDMVFPVDLLPEWLREVVQYLPGYAVTQLVRPPLLNEVWSSAAWTHVAVVAAYALGSTLIAALLFRWAPRS